MDNNKSKSIQKIKANNEFQGMDDTDWNLLLRRINEGRCTPFLGAGACAPYLPLGFQIAQQLAKKYNYPLSDIENLPSVTQFIAIKEKDSISPKEIIIEILKKYKTPNFADCELPHSVLAGLPLPIYLTTNYDDFMIQALHNKRKNVKFEYCRWNRFISDEPPKIEKDFQPSIDTPLVYYLHGFWDIPESLVLTEDDYMDFLVNVSENMNQSLHHRIRRSLTGTSLVFIGYRLDDLSFRTIFRGLINSPEKSLKRKNISVQISPMNERKESLENSFGQLDDFILRLNINQELKNKIKNSILELKQETSLYLISKEKKDLIYYKINTLESQFYELSLEDNDRKFLVYIINLLQDSVGKLPTDEERKNQLEAVKYLEDYYEEMDIRIFWGSAQKFAEELRERWDDFEGRNSRNE